MKSKNYSDNQDFVNYPFEKKKDILQADAFNIMKKYFYETLNEESFLTEIKSLTKHNILTFEELIDFLKPISSYEAMETSHGKTNDQRQELKRKFTYK
jgi:hypothetical protein